MSSRAQREVTRERAEARKAEKAAQVAWDAQKQLEKEAAVKKAISKKPKELLSVIPLLNHVKRVAPRLLEVKDYELAVEYLSELKHVRDYTMWEPKGKGRETLFRSIAEHLLSSFRTPAFLWSVFFETDKAIMLLVGRLAAGGSLYDEVKTGNLPVPLTRKMCHDFLQQPSETKFLTAIRRTQVLAAGGDERLVRTVMATMLGQGLLRKDAEVFWATFIEWLAKNPMLESSNVGPLVDYIRYRRNEDLAFSLKGRSALALLRNMEEWHGNLAKQKVLSGSTFKPSGFRSGCYEVAKRQPDGNYVTYIWAIEEILSAKNLQKEGRDMSHCVFSYASQIESGAISIWSLTLDESKCVTVEVHNKLRRIMQVRGRFNRRATTQEIQTLQVWANENKLEIPTSHW